MILFTEDVACMIWKWSKEHGRKLHPKPKLLVMAEAYLSATLGPNISDLFGVRSLWFHWELYKMTELFWAWSKIKSKNNSEFSDSNGSTFTSCNARHLCSECIPNTGNLQSPPRPQTNLCVRESLWNWTGSCKQQGRLSICHEKCPHFALVMMQSFCVLAQYENLLRLISQAW